MTSNAMLDRTVDAGHMGRTAALSGLVLFSTWYGLLAVLITAGISISMPEYQPLLVLIRLSLIATMVVSVLYGAAGWREGVVRTAMPLVVNVLALVLIVALPFRYVWDVTLFNSRLPSYNHVATLVAEGKLQPDANGFASLPFGYRWLAADGQVHIQRENGVLQLYFAAEQRGVRQAGYMYRAENRFPPSMFSSEIVWEQMEQLAPGWYYCASYE